MLACQILDSFLLSKHYKPHPAAILKQNMKLLKGMKLCGTREPIELGSTTKL